MRTNRSIFPAVMSLMAALTACAPPQPLARPIAPERARAVLACAVDQMRGAGFEPTGSAARADAVHGQRRVTQGERTWTDVLTARVHPALEQGGWVLEMFLGTNAYNYDRRVPPPSGLARSTAYAILATCAPRAPATAAPSA